MGHFVLSGVIQGALLQQQAMAPLVVPLPLGSLSTAQFSIKPTKPMDQLPAVQVAILAFAPPVLDLYSNDPSRSS